MDLWKSLSPALKSQGFSDARLSQLAPHFHGVDPEKLFHLELNELVALVAARGGSLSTAEVAALKTALQAVLERSRTAPPTPASTPPDAVRFTVRLRDADTSDKRLAGHFDVRIAQPASRGTPEVELFKGHVGSSGGRRLVLPAAAATGKVRVLVSGLDGEAVLDHTIQLDPKKPDITLDLPLASYRANTAAPLAAWERALGKTIPATVTDIFRRLKVTSLADLRHRAVDALKTEGLAARDRKALNELLAHAHLQLLSRDHKVNQRLIDAGFRDVFSIAELSEATFVARLKGHPSAAVVYTSAKTKLALLKNLALEARVAKANRQALAKGPAAFMSAPAPEFSTAPAQEADAPPCACDCQSAVSPLAYLTDLLDFAIREVDLGNISLKLGDLEREFGQPFGALPADCSASEQIVRQVRICIEVLRARIALVTAAPGAAPVMASSVVEGHPRRVYDALLREIGTSYRELRLLRGATAEVRAAKAASLGVSVDHLNDLLPVDGGLTENWLERLFGWQDTARDPLSFGAKVVDASNQLRRWSLTGVEWKKNTDERGRIYANVSLAASKAHVDLYSDQTRTTPTLVATTDDRRTVPPDLLSIDLAAAPGSTLRGRFLVKYVADDETLEIAAIPELVAWRLSALRAPWMAEDHPSSPFDAGAVARLLIVDPDLLTEDDFRKPLDANAAYKLWKSRDAQMSAKLLLLTADTPAAAAAAPLTIQQRLQQRIEKVWPPPPGIVPYTWDAIAADLAGGAPVNVATAMAELETLKLSPEGFAFLRDLGSRAVSGATDPEILAREEAELVRATDILIDVVKRRDFYPVWKAEEAPRAATPAAPATPGITLSPELFCLSDADPEPRVPRAPAAARALWKQALRAASEPPIIDPDILPRTVPLALGDDSLAYKIWDDREKELSDALTSLTGMGPVPSMTHTLAWLDARLTTAIGPAVIAEVHSLGIEPLAELPELQARFNAKEPLGISAQQHGLTRRELSALLAFRNLLLPPAGGGIPPGAMADDWDEVFQILVGAEKRRYRYPAWRAEEVAKGLTLSPDFFTLSEHALLQFAPVPERSEAFRDWRENVTVLRVWRQTLKARFEQQAAVMEGIRNAVDRAEEATLPPLRDALIDVLYSDPLGAKRYVNARDVTNQLLINALETGCRKTTRVGQAIETLQLLIWGIRNRQIEARPVLPPPAAPAAPVEFSMLIADSDGFKETWEWLGSYATWRSAMFVFLYPDNLLYPSLYKGGTPVFEVVRGIISAEIVVAQTPDPGPSSEPAVEDEPTLADRIARIAFYILGRAVPTSPKGIRWLIWHMLDLRRRVEIGAESSTVEPAPSEHPDDTLVQHMFSGRPFRRIEWADYGNSTANQVELEDTYLLPMHAALTLQRGGLYEDALEFYRWVYDYERNTFRFPRVADLLGRRDGDYERDGDWLADPLDPHRIAATRTSADLRFILISIITCHLEYAEAEFAADTTESVARARELYLTAQRLLEESDLGQPPKDCDGAIKELIIEVGEYIKTLPKHVDLDLIGVIFGGGFTFEPQVLSELLQGLKAVLKPLGTGPRPVPAADVRSAVLPVLRKHASKPLVADVGWKVREIYGNEVARLERQLWVGNTFDRVQRAAGMRASPPTVALPVTLSAVATLSTAATYALPPFLVLPDPDRKIPGVVFTFCIPPNPVLRSLRLRTEVGLFKLANCMNLSGLRRDLPAYAAATDTFSGLPSLGASGAIALPGTFRLQPTPYRYNVLVERAKLLVATAQQMESSYFAFLDRLDQERYGVLKARQDLAMAGANVALQGLRLTEAGHGKDLAQDQLDRAGDAHEYYADLAKEGRSELEKLSITLIQAAMWTQFGIAAARGLVPVIGALAADIMTGGVTFATSETVAAIGAAAADAQIQSSFIGGLSAWSSIVATEESFRRREEEWAFQRDLANDDITIAKTQKTLAADRYAIVSQEQAIATLSKQHASDVLTFLDGKFTNTDLFEWMSGVVGNVYRYFLQQATATAKLAQMQLWFERQEDGLDFILSDYWTAPTGKSLGLGSDGGPDRRGMTGSARLLQDLTKLDQHAFTTDRRKLQLSKTISLAMFDPIAFLQFRESGVMNFGTTLEHFDRDFPGHYLRLIKRVRTTVIALVPPTEGIKATLSSRGASLVVISTLGGGQFEERSISRGPESVALTSPINASGVFELQEQSQMLLPFEGIGVAGGWTFAMPRAANRIDFGSIADVLVTIEYTAFESATYRGQVIERLDPTISFARPFSLRREFSDCWYDLTNPELIEKPENRMVVSFDIRREDFLPNVDNLVIEEVTLYVACRTGASYELTLKLSFMPSGAGGSIIGEGTAVDGELGHRRGNAPASWGPMRGEPPAGRWTLALPKDTVEQFKTGEIQDILFVLTVGGTSPPWPA